MAKASLTETRRVRYDEDLYAWSLQQAASLRARRADSLDWQIALVRRINSTANHRLSVGMTKLSGTVHAARLRLACSVRELQPGETVRLDLPDRAPH